MKQGSYRAINAIAWVIILFLLGCQQKAGEEDGIRKTLPKEGDDQGVPGTYLKGPARPERAAF